MDAIKNKLTTIAENEPKVYEAGKTSGEATIEQSQWNEFWDTFQTNGNRKSYAYCFQGGTWSDQTFKPKYDLKPTNATYMFAYNGHYDGARLIDIKELLEEVGVTLDTSSCTNMTGFCYLAKSITRFPIISHEGATNLNSTFHQCTALKSIEKLILKADGTNTFQNNSYDRPFYSCSALEHMIVEGVIGKSNFNVQWSTKLDKESIVSIVNALSPTTSGLTVTLSKTAVNNAFGINLDDVTTYPEGSEWYELRNSKSNWTIDFA